MVFNISEMIPCSTDDLEVRGVIRIARLIAKIEYVGQPHGTQGARITDVGKEYEQSEQLMIGNGKEHECEAAEKVDRAGRYILKHLLPIEGTNQLL